jgi:hypothetical protein
MFSLLVMAEGVGFAQILLDLTPSFGSAQQSNQALSARVWNLGRDYNSGQFWVQAPGLNTSVSCPTDRIPLGSPIVLRGKSPSTSDI